MNIDAGNLALWVYDNGWSPITDASFGLDANSHLIWGTAGSAEYFAAAPIELSPVAVSIVIPEPSTMALGLAAGAALLLRRRRRLS
jgi:hypothetical protein